MSADDIDRALRRISHEIVETQPAIETVVLVGVHTRGVFLAHRIAAHIEAIGAGAVPVGELDIGLYRDDLSERGEPTPRPTRIPADITSSSLVVVDDVLYTGRTVRAALDALTDIGRAQTTDLVVLVDRGHRELPIKADYVGKNIPTSRDEMVKVRLTEVDGVEGVWLEGAVAA